MGELTDKIAKLEQTVLARDVAAAAMLQNCEDMEEAGTAALAKVMLELQAAVKAKEVAEKERNNAEMQVTKRAMSSTLRLKLQKVRRMHCCKNAMRRTCLNLERN